MEILNRNLPKRNLDSVSKLSIFRNNPHNVFYVRHFYLYGMANQSMLTALFLMSNSTVFDHNNNSSEFNIDVISHRYVIEKFRLAFVVLGIVIGVIAIGFNTAIIISSLVKTSYIATTFSTQTLNLMTSLAVADLFLLVFGLPYDLVAANDNPWLEGKIGCQMSAYLPEASRFAWVGTVALSMPLRWPSIMKIMRKWAPAWTMFVWAVSLAVVIPFALHVDCLGLSHTTTVDYATIPETVDSLLGQEDENGACFCVFTVSQSEVVQMFGSSLVVYSLIPVMAIGRISLKGRPFLDETPDIKENTSSRRLVAMLLAFMTCTLPRYVYILVNYSEENPTTDGLHGFVMSIIEIICCSLFYCSTLIHLILSPHPRSLLRHLCRQQQDYAIENEVA